MTQGQRELTVALGFIAVVLLAAIVASAATGEWYWLLAAASGIVLAAVLIAVMSWLSDWIDRGVR